MRMVLLKDIDEHGLVFYTNLQSQKARQMTENPQASACFWWPPLKRQVRFPGRVNSSVTRKRMNISPPAARQPDPRLGLAAEQRTRVASTTA